MARNEYHFSDKITVRYGKSIPDDVPTNWADQFYERNRILPNQAVGLVASWGSQSVQVVAFDKKGNATIAYRRGPSVVKKPVSWAALSNFRKPKKAAERK